MISRLSIVNYQSHKGSMFEFSPFVNVIIGDNNAGKTAAFRALNWVAFNRPQGGVMLNNSLEKGVVVGEILFSSPDALVTLTKSISKDKEGKKKARSAVYNLGDEKFTGFGASVPDAIEQAVNFGELNVQHQLDGPFLIASSPGEVARTINRITHLDKSDGYIRAVNSDLSDANRKISTSLERIEQLEVEIKSYEGLEEVGVSLREYKTFESDIKSSMAKVEDISRSVSEVNRLNSWIDGKYEIVKSCSKLLEDIDAAGKELRDKNFLASELERLFHFEHFILGCSGIENVLDEIWSAESFLKNISDLNEEIEQVESLNEILDDISTREEMYSSAVEKLKDVLKEEKKCPLCLGEIDDEAIKRILEEI